MHNPRRLGVETRSSPSTPEALLFIELHNLLSSMVPFATATESWVLPKGTDRCFPTPQLYAPKRSFRHKRPYVCAFDLQLTTYRSAESESNRKLVVDGSRTSCPLPLYVGSQVPPFKTNKKKSPIMIPIYYKIFDKVLGLADITHPNS